MHKYSRLTDIIKKLSIKEQVINVIKPKMIL